MSALGVLCTELTPLLLLPLWAVRAVCSEGRSRGSAGLLHAMVTTLLWPQAAQCGHDPWGLLGSLDWAGCGGEAFTLLFPILGFPALRSEETGTRGIAFRLLVKGSRADGPCPALPHTALMVPEGQKGPGLQICRGMCVPTQPSSGRCHPKSDPFACKSPQTRASSPGLVEGGGAALWRH